MSTNWLCNDWRLNPWPRVATQNVARSPVGKGNLGSAGERAGPLSETHCRSEGSLAITVTAAQYNRIKIFWFFFMLYTQSCAVGFYIKLPTNRWRSRAAGMYKLKLRWSSPFPLYKQHHDNASGHTLVFTYLLWSCLYPCHCSTVRMLLNVVYQFRPHTFCIQSNTGVITEA